MVKIPLLKDNHNHFFAYSALSEAIDISNVTSKKKVFDKLGELKPNTINIISRWFDNVYSFCADELKDFPPLIICNNSLHKYVFNDKAAEIISKSYPEWVDNNDDQEWVEKNIMHIFAFIAGLNVIDINLLNNRLNMNLQEGVVFANDMYVTDSKVFKLISTTGINKYTNFFTDPLIYPKLNDTEKQFCKGVKIFLDGALGAYSAAIKTKYKTKHSGLLTYTNSELFEYLELCFSLKTGIAIHCIGDLAIEQAVNTIKKLRNNYCEQQIRLEHAQFISYNQAKQAKDLGIVLSMQPNFNNDSIIYPDRLPEYYCKNNNPFRMLIDEIGFVPGKDLIFGSDGMPTGIDAAIKQSLFPPFDGQKLTLDEFVAGYCCDNYEHGHILLEVDQINSNVISKAIIDKSIVV